MKIKITQDNSIMPAAKAPAPAVTTPPSVPAASPKAPAPAVTTPPPAPAPIPEPPVPSPTIKPLAPTTMTPPPAPAPTPPPSFPAPLPPAHLASTGHPCSRAQAEQILTWAAEQHGGGWVGHSRTAARVAETIAQRVATLSPDRAYTFALLHDIGRYEGNTQLHHILAGYHLLLALGFPEEARICLTHSCYSMKLAKTPTYWPGIDNPAELRFLVNFINTVELTDYDRLVQLADLMSLDAGVFTINDRFCDSVSRYHLSEPAEDLRARQALKTHFDRLTGLNIYTLFRAEITRHALNP